MKLTISTPSRLHFGLLSVGGEVERTFGGVGLMVSSPRTVIETASADRFTVGWQDAQSGVPDDISLADDGSTIAAARNAASLWFDYFGKENCPSLQSLETLPVKLSLDNACPRHVGLGSGTQLALAVGLSLQRFFGLPEPKPNELAQALRRADRSAIGTFGFFEGGFLVDGGKTANESVSPIDMRVDFPEHWPIAIVRFIENPNLEQSSAGLHGDAEQVAFDTVAPTTEPQLQWMRSLVKDKMVPGVLSESYDVFAESVYEFGRQSGQYFAAVQGGRYASRSIAEVVETIFDAGVKAVGQTSWGPSVFAIGENWSHLQSAVSQLKKRFGDQCHIEITHADNRGVLVSEELPSPSP